ncbi:MAG: 2,3-cyclic 3-phosphodiesterase [Verrucomicrobiota bacterium]|jgi:2'-5' RNA ligase
MGKRLFVAIDLPESLQQSLADLDPQIRGMRWTVPEQFHLTLSFLGDVGEEPDQRLREKLNVIEFHSFFLPLAGIGTFPPRGVPKIIWIGVGSGHPHLFQVYKRVQEAVLAVGLEPDLRTWHPHITLARCRNPSPSIIRFLRENAEIDAGMIRVDAFHLYSSKLQTEGSVHTRELTIPCSGGL